MDKRSVMAFVVIFVILILMPVYYKWVTPESDDAGIPQDSISIADTPPETRRPSAQRTEGTTRAERPKMQLRSREALPKQDETVYSIENDVYRIQLSSIGGGTIRSSVLKEYNKSVDSDSLVELINPSRKNPLILRFISIDGDSAILDQNYELSYNSMPIGHHNRLEVQNDEKLVLTFTLAIDDGVEVRKTFTFYGDRYQIDLKTDLSEAQDYAATSYYELSWDGGLSYTEALTKDEIYYSKAYAFSGNELETVNAKSGKYDLEQFRGSTDWMAIRTKYFCSVFIPERPALGYTISSKGIPMQGNEYQKIFSMHLQLPIDRPMTTTIFIGPLDHALIKSMDTELDQIMTFGFKLIRPISKGILWTFKKMNSFIPNYGLVLIIFSILVKVLLSPLTNRSTRSMMEMQKLQPKITALREKYSEDAQKLNEETMKLYKEHGVNPMGGCLPLLLQMPILIALFTIFRSTIELRHAPFILWITDLSSPDTVYTLPFSIPIYGNHVNVLPFIMVISTFIQQKLTTSASGNPQQKMMAYMMPIFFFFLFNQFPSGLNLYYTLFNILSVVQQKLLPPKPKKPKKSKQSTFQALREMQAKYNKRK